MITKNSLAPCLKESLNSLFRNIPVNKLIIVDSYSTDGTIELINSYFGKGIEVKLIQKDCKRGKAREIGIKDVKTEFFAFVDSDVIIAENWFEEMKGYIKANTGAVEGNVNNQMVNPNGRGYTNCTLIRTNLVKNICIPDEMDVFEDQFIRRHIEGKGFKWLKILSPSSKHISSSDRVRDAFEVGRMSGKYGLFPFWRNLGVCFLIPIKYLKYGDSPKIYFNKLIGHLEGYLERRFDRD